MARLLNELMAEGRRGGHKRVDKRSIDNFEMEATGRKTFAGQTDVNLTLKMHDRLLYELCVSPDVPVNLDSYTYDHHNNNEYRVEMVEYTH